ncbi:palmitoyltransferase ZDHHC8B-like [Paramormyrops kingsleyae]|uniref:Palmitoyltransferase n=1 Tax=Paramormyrops kingsleyae TaxID=1676925 RepID=A0A3B3QM10_9TELE|nr:probable palmitoyltransferase ZDHHC8 [Paramormyrops kingsleyae]
MPGIVGKTFKPTTFIPVSSAATLLVGSTTLFFVFTCPWLTRTISPIVPLYNGIVFVFVLANFGMATFMDSGVFPRATEEEEDKEDDFRAPLYKNVEVKGIQVRMKWCASCHFYRPPRCSHCSVCDHCVEDFDHHCPWVNNCIGRRNYRYFFLFLLSLSIHMVGVFSFGLLFVMHHLERLEALQTTVTLAVMCVSGLFFIPVGGLTGFHMVLVVRGRTTNEQVTGKFKGGVNPFSRGCWGNTEYVLCSPLAPRYMVPPRKQPSVSIQPPFLQPELSDGQMTFMFRDNGKSNIFWTKSKGSLDVITLAPRPDPGEDCEPKPRLADGEGLSAQAFFKYQVPFGSVAEVQYCAAGEQVTISGRHRASASLDGVPRGQDYFSEPDLDLPDCRNQLAPWALQSPLLQLDSCSLHSRSLSLRESHQHRDQLQALPGKPEDSAPHSSALTPSMLYSRNGSLSYDSLLHPSPNALTMMDCLAHPGPPSLGCRLPFQPTNQFSAWLPELPCPVLVGRHSPHPKNPSPVGYDSLPKTVMASIQERRETEDERQLQVQSHFQPQPDPGVYDMPRLHSLYPGPCYSEGPRVTKSRSPTPPIFGSRDNLIGSGGRVPQLHSSASRSSMTSVTSMTSMTSVHTDTSGSGAQAPPKPLHCPPSYSSSSTPQENLPFVNTSDTRDMPPQGSSRYDS